MGLLFWENNLTLRTIYFLALLLVFQNAGSVAASEPVTFKNCSVRNECFKGNRFIAWITSKRLLGNKLIVTVRYQSDSGSSVSAKFKGDAGYVEILDSSGNIYRADPKRLSKAKSVYGEPADFRIFIEVDPQFKPPFDLSVRSTDDGSIDIVAINLE